MDNSLTKILEINVQHLIKGPPSNILQSMKPIEPRSKIINLIPKYVPQDKKISNIVLSKPKEPKFIPYEPYKAAVQPIKTQKPKKKILNLTVDVKPSKNNVEIQELVSFLSVSIF